MEENQSGGLIRKRVRSWLPVADIEEGAMRQIDNLASLPFIHRYVAVMPDCHLGKGAPIGTVIATKRAVVCAAVGVDLGCGMMAVRTTVEAEALRARGVGAGLREIREALEGNIPMGKGRENRVISDSAQARIDDFIEIPRLAPVRAHWQHQLGSLGGGNHFIELVGDEEGFVWAFLHSGSRGAGLQIATHYIKAAKRLMEDYFITLPDKDLAYIPQGHDLFKQYLNDVKWAQRYAELNRDEMMDRTLAILSEHVGSFEQTDVIRCHHNFVQWEQHDGENMLVTRKGAIRLRGDERGLIPGSMGTHSYVVRGRDNAGAFYSAPHGAGRRMSRTAAKREYSVQDLREQTMGVEVRITDQLVDELPTAYKDINQVMVRSADLVQIEHTFTPIVNAKGD